jgi:tryptophanyl-tRNA synthetase
MGLLERCHSFKDKTARGLAASHGLFAYPVLMAADILIYDSDIVPVGRDQKQHLEVTRDVAIKMNETFGEIFKLPQPSIREETAVVPGLDGAKMSKSYNNTIEIFAPEAALRKKIMGIKTDSTPVEAPKPEEGSVILDLYKLVASAGDYEEMLAAFRNGGTGYGDLKKGSLQESGNTSLHSVPRGRLCWLTPNSWTVFSQRGPPRRARSQTALCEGSGQLWE